MPVFSSGGGGEQAIFAGNKTITGTLTVPLGSSSAPAIQFGSVSIGLYGSSTDLNVVTGGSRNYAFLSGDFYILGAGKGIVLGASNDSIIRPTAAGSISIGGTGSGQLLGVKTLAELTTIAAAATTDTTIQMPAGAIVLAVSVRVTVLIPTAATFTVGDSGSAARFNTGTSVLVAATTTNAGTKAGAYYNASALAIRLTPNLTPADNSGRVRVTIHYIDCTPPTA